MNKSGNSSWERQLGARLKQEAAADRPLFAAPLQEQIMQSVQVRAAAQATAPHTLRGSLVWVVAALVLVAVTVTPPAIRLATESKIAHPPTPESYSTLAALAAPINNTLAELSGTGGAVTDELVEEVLLCHWEFLDRNADVIGEFLCDPLPLRWSAATDEGPRRTVQEL